jgi:hypothetical protein
MGIVRGIREAIRRRKNFVGIHVHEEIGSGRQGVVRRATVSRKGKERSFALKRYIYWAEGREPGSSYRRALGGREQKIMAQDDAHKLHLLKKLGFPTVPFPTPTRKGLLMKDLTEKGQKRVVDMQQATNQFYRMHGNKGNDNRGFAPMTPRVFSAGPSGLAVSFL